VKVDEVLRWLERAGEDLTLVGGQSVALWEHLLGLPVLTETVDIDFLGDAAQAQELADALGYDCRIPDSVDPTPNTAILVDDAGVVVADFLAFVAGLNETDILRRRLPGDGWSQPKLDHPHLLLLARPRARGCRSFH
jgi:hypothetical protein